MTRHPYSFIGDSREPQGPGGLKGSDGSPPTETWHDALLGYMGGNPIARDQAEAGMRAQGADAGIQFDYHVKAQWQPVESQRLLLWAARHGLQEEFMSALNRRHFEQRQSASERPTLLAAAEEAGLDASAASAFLETDDLADVVWRSYGRTIRELRIHSIPLFSMSVPQIGAVGGCAAHASTCKRRHHEHPMQTNTPYTPHANEHTMNTPCKRTHLTHPMQTNTPYTHHAEIPADT